MKKLFLTLLLISPLAKSEILELTCESAFPFQISYNFETKEGFVIHADNLDAIDRFETKSITQSKGKQLIKELVIKGDYYAIYHKSRLAAQGIYHIYVNRKNLNFWVQSGTGGNRAFSGKCTQGLHELLEYQI